MKHNRFYSLLMIAVILSMLMPVIRVTPVLAAESIILYPSRGLPGTDVGVNGTGFTAGHAIGIYFGGVPMAYETIISTTFSIHFDVPNNAEPGSHKVEVIDWDIDPPQVVASQWFTVTAGVIDLSTNTGPVGTWVEISGDHFGDRQDITIEYDGGEIGIESGDDRTDTVGEFTCIIIIPESTRGAHTITVEDESGIYAEAEFHVEPGITINPSSGVGGNEVVVIGTGFRAGRSVTITFNGFTITTNPTYVSTGTRGSFQASFHIPTGTQGSYKVEASDGIYKASTQFTRRYSYSISHTSGDVGFSITVNGTGFKANSSVNITFGSILIVTTSTDAYGNFTNTFIVPSLASGTYEVKASDGVNMGSAHFTVLSSFSISKTSSYVGTEIVVNGTGFGASKTIYITFNNIQVGATTTDANGNFTGNFLVPSVASGDYEVTVSDGVNMGNADFIVLVDASLSPTTSHDSPGYVGTELTISGLGFKPNATVAINYDGAKIATAPTNSSGLFSVAFKVPPSVNGSHTITATDGINTREFTFVMESGAPSPPALSVPESGTKANAEAYFDWEDVTDPSGVIYNLQIASDANFNNIVLEEKDLIHSEYIVNKEDKLASVSKDEPYYWRIRALDGASNKSDWTDVWSFYVGFTLAVPSWAIYLLCGIGALLCGVIGFWLGRRTASPF